MNKIEDLFKKRSGDILNIYFTAGYPELASTTGILTALQNYGADLIEIGMPYSDPLADGPVIQASSMKALQNGMTIATLLEQLRSFKPQLKVPLVLMGYMNPVLQYGFERFCADASEAGVSGLIIPDLPWLEYETGYREIVKKYGLDFIFLVTPETTEDRVRKLDKLSSGFVYAVSSSSTTGTDKNMNKVATYLERLRSYQLKNPVLVGFGIKDKASFREACRYANGAIIGTAYIQALKQGPVEESTRKFLEGILN